MKKQITTILALCVASGMIQAAAQAQTQQSETPQEHLRLLVGTYTENTTAQGVYLYSYDPETADTKLLGVASSGNPSFVVASPDGTRAYTVNEYNDGRQAVSAFRLASDSIELINTIPIPQNEVSGEDPCNILLIPAGITTGATEQKPYDVLITSNYTGGSVTAFAADTNEGLIACTQWYSTGIEYTHALLGTSLGSDPAHMHCAALSPDGRFLYTSHRLKEDGIAIFSVDPASGKVTRTGFQPTGTHPRNFAISPDGRYLLCACRDSNAIKIYTIDKNSGALSPAGKAIEVGAPVCVQFVSL